MKLNAILLTPGHWDYIYGLDDLKKDFPDVPVYMPEDGYDFLEDSYLNGSSMNGFEVYVDSEVNSISEGELDFDGYKIEVINTPIRCK